MPPTSTSRARAKRPTSSQPWSRPQRAAAAPTHPYLRIVRGLQKPDRRRDRPLRPATSTSLDVGTGIGQGYVYKFDSEGKPVLGFGEHGKLSVRDGRVLQLADPDRRRQRPGQPQPRRPLRPRNRLRRQHSRSRSTSPNGDHAAEHRNFGPSGVGGRLRATGDVYVDALFPAGAHAVYNTAGESRTSSSQRITRRNPRVSRSAPQRQGLRRQRRRLRGAERHDRGLQHAGDSPRTARREPVLRRWRSIRATATSTSTKAIR